MNNELKDLILLPTKVAPALGIAFLVASSTILLQMGLDNIGLVTLLAKLGLGFMIIGAIAQAIVWLWNALKT